jgi:hypothetical protein
MFSSPKLRLVALCVLFTVAVGGPAAWFRSGTHENHTQLRFSGDSPSDYQFLPEELSAQAADILATTNAISGTFVGKNGRFPVFLGTWDGSDSRQLTALQHTPDICWVGAGWVPVRGDYPDKITLRVSGMDIPFECRVFRAASGVHQVAVWTSVVAGRLYEEPAPLAIESAGETRRASRVAAKRVAFGQFYNALKMRLPGDGTKQFVRFSTDLSADWATTVRQLQEFGERWLKAEVTTSQRPRA